jgi:glycosyltransferase involved in cell wall biosynthesis
VNLLLLPNLGAYLKPNGTALLTKKLLDGIEEYANHWVGEIAVLLHPLKEAEAHPDLVEVGLEQFSFKLVLTDYTDSNVKDYVTWADAVLAGTAHTTNFVSPLCQQLGTPLIYITELTLATRIQITNADNISRFKKLKKIVWSTRQELRQVHAIWNSTAVQCNGFPTFNSYRSLTSSALLFFDSRLKTPQMISKTDLQVRLNRLKTKLEKKEKINLVFSGRFERIKGVDTLIDLAEELSRRNFKFNLYLAGSGSLQQELETLVKQKKLADNVKFLGVLDFEEQLLPWVKENADLFICCHRQGDPSCTYLETLGCGVPIIGFKNESLSDLLSQSDSGITLSSSPLSKLADAIEYLKYSRIEKMSLNALNFSLEHGFQETFKKRVGHILECIDEKKKKRYTKYSKRKTLEVFYLNAKSLMCN